MSEGRTLGISAASTSKPAKSAFALTGARYEKLKERARDQRRNPTPAQAALWVQLSGSKLGGVKFTRQFVLGSALVDFACPSRWIAVLISPEGANAEVDALQDKKLTDVGVRVLRFAEADVLEDISSVLKAISDEVNRPFDKRTARRNAGQLFAQAEDDIR